MSAGSGVATLACPTPRGSPPGTSADTIVAPYNPPVELSDSRRELAAVIVEPVAANMGVVPPAPGFLEGSGRACAEQRALLIFDEVVTGFRVGYHGAQGLFGINPDLTILGKVIGGGLPVGAYGGRDELMETGRPRGLGLPGGNPVGQPDQRRRRHRHPEAACRDPDDLPCSKAKGAALEEGLEQAARARPASRCAVQRVGSMFTAFFQEGAVTDLEAAKRSDTARFARFFHAMLEEGVYWPPAQFEAAFVSAAHVDEDMEAIVAAAGRATGKDLMSMDRKLMRYAFFKVDPAWRRLPDEERALHKKELAPMWWPAPPIDVQPLLDCGHEGRLRAGALADRRGPGGDPGVPGLDERHRPRPLPAQHLLLHCADPQVAVPQGPQARGPGVQHAGRTQGLALPVRLPDGQAAPLVQASPSRSAARSWENTSRSATGTPNVAIHTGYSFGLDDQEFVVAFEGSSLGEFLDLVEELRGSESSAFTARDVPIFTCVKMPIEKILDQLDGAA